MKKTIIRDCVLMMLFWAIIMALDSYDWAFDVVNDFEDVVGDLMPWASYEAVEETNTIIWICAITAFCSFSVTRIGEFFKKLFNK